MHNVQHDGQMCHAVQVDVMDGLDAVAQRAQHSPGRLRVLIIDAGSGDASLAMTCPPAPFLQAAFLDHARAALAHESLLIMNCVTRSANAFKDALSAIKVLPLMQQCSSWSLLQNYS